MLIDDWEVCTHFAQRLRDSCSERYILKVYCMNDDWKWHGVRTHKLTSEGCIHIIYRSFVGVPSHSALGWSISCTVKRLQCFCYPTLSRGHCWEFINILDCYPCSSLQQIPRIASQYALLSFWSAWHSFSNLWVPIGVKCREEWLSELERYDIHAILGLLFCKLSVDRPFNLASLL